MCRVTPARADPILRHGGAPGPGSGPDAVSAKDIDMSVIEPPREPEYAGSRAVASLSAANRNFVAAAPKGCPDGQFHPRVPSAAPESVRPPPGRLELRKSTWTWTCIRNT
ncbi:hypothetical protein CPLU01_05688 [Colletotrichum plurivorum]|uniref:Uncharacterized protein n=1 Tax=Colletotrichum plurivorum TaxID=2175906 RepID=A0A8H6KKD3_9PEZI|nr:hypothetical protein CPLU01_05688 [Colletotrichum plurivorum]